MWQGTAAARWLQEQARLDELLRPFGQAAQMTLAAASGEWILDVGCGAGTTSFELADTVGPSGGVYGIDISEPLLQRAKERADAAGSKNTHWVLADAATHRFERGFDALYSRFGVMFFSDPVAAFSNLAAALQRSGRLSFVCWQELDRNPWANLPLTAARAAAPELGLPTMFQLGQPGPFAFGDQEYVNDSLKAAGFRQVDITRFERPVHLGASADDAADSSLVIGPTSRFAAEAAPELKASIRSAIVEALKPFDSPRGVWLDAATYVVSARA
jgi:ubiquinone/menaquinone biosynthesis C-methylase UbiE